MIWANIAHKKEPKYKCETCDKSFFIIKNLKRHLHTVHEGHKDYKCESCGKSFSRKNRLRLRRERASESLPRTSHKFEGEKLREQTQVSSLLHVPGETRLFAGLAGKSRDNGALVSVDLASGEIGSRVELGGLVASSVCSNFKFSNGWFF